MNSFVLSLFIIKDYEIVFSGPVTDRWHGSAANVKESKGKCVYGAVYIVTNEDLIKLDM